jgi:hypothetical protein
LGNFPSVCNDVLVFTIYWKNTFLTYFLLSLHVSAYLAIHRCVYKGLCSFCNAVVRISLWFWAWSFYGFLCR